MSAIAFTIMKIRGLHEMIKPKNVAVGYARRHIFGFYIAYNFLNTKRYKNCDRNFRSPYSRWQNVALYCVCDRF
jgi:hypothetical protein